MCCNSAGRVWLEDLHDRRRRRGRGRTERVGEETEGWGGARQRATKRKMDWVRVWGKRDTGREIKMQLNAPRPAELWWYRMWRFVWERLFPQAQTLRVTNPSMLQHIPLAHRWAVLVFWLLSQAALTQKDNTAALRMYSVTKGKGEVGNE